MGCHFETRWPISSAVADSDFVSSCRKCPMPPAVGAELNEELAKISKGGKLQEKHEPPSITKIDFAA
jgi:hypothetical protein